MKNNLVPGLYGIDKDMKGKYINHFHICELILIGKSLNIPKRKIQKQCPVKLSYYFMKYRSCDACENCSHNKCITLSDSGNEIIDII